ncbi:MAG: glycerol-3-phosphate 1-O-acyltransferase PlsY [Lachnospiraceae bacterium]|jgi:glycerol-3-phosphate acyltransferase PlsY|nr:glycerol-3-phosphate 1-O-acyltransferase PlsY [Lachnospiraceae bacterium]
MIRILCLVFGYAFGLIQSGYLFAKMHHVDIYSVGSGNPGSTNVLRSMGVRAGAAVFLMDVLKTMVPLLIVRIVYSAVTGGSLLGDAAAGAGAMGLSAIAFPMGNAAVAGGALRSMLTFGAPGALYLYLLYTGIGVILGHNYPFYLHFRGGKGIASTAGLVLSTDLRIAAVCLVVFVVLVAATRYVSLGSIAVLLIYMAGLIWFALHGGYGLWAVYRPEFCALAVVVAALGIWRHRSNIHRLLTHTENKIGAKKPTENGAA